MKETMKRIGIFITCFCVICGNMVNTKIVLACGNGEENIKAYYAAINQGNIDELYNLVGESYLEDIKDIYSNKENVSSHVGIFDIKTVKVKEIEEEKNVDRFELSTYSEPVEVVYKVATEMEVYTGEDCFKNGRNVCYFLMNHDGKIIGCWNFEEEDSNQISMLSYDTPISNVTSNPSTIRVKIDGEIKKVDFKKYVKVVTRCEVGYSTWKLEALKACAVAIKNYGIARCIRHKYAGQGFDVKATTADQVYNPSKENIPICSNAVDLIWNVFWIDANDKLFPGFHVHSKEFNSYAVKNGGVLSQTKAQDLAKNHNYNWVDILRYFYDRKKGTKYFNSEVAYGTTFMNVYK